jgi:hypothetical protein
MNITNIIIVVAGISAIGALVMLFKPDILDGIFTPFDDDDVDEDGGVYDPSLPPSGEDPTYEFSTKANLIASTRVGQPTLAIAVV